MTKKYKMTTAIPDFITTPDRVETRLGTLEFFDGYPSHDTVQKCYDNLLFMRGVEIFLNWIPAASMFALREGFREAGITRNGVVGIYETLMDSQPLFLTANMDSIYTITWLDLKEGPMVVESPPNTLGMVNDFFFRYVADLGNAGPDKGRGGTFLFLPPDYEGDVPDGYFVYRSLTYNNCLFWRGFLVNGDPKPGVESIKTHTHIYPLSKPEDREKTEFINWSGKHFNTIHANNFHFYEEINAVIQEEPAAAFSSELLGLLLAIGIEKGRPFNPDERVRHILTEAVAVGNATARSISFHQKGSELLKDAFIYEDSAWFNPFLGSYQFLKSGARSMDGRVMFHYPYTAVTPAMAVKLIGVGSQYGVVAMDAEGEYLDGAHTYKLTFPPDVPAKDFWSVLIYDPQTRSMLQTDQQFPGLNSMKGDVNPNADGSYDIYFGPEPPEGQEDNWIQTIPGKGFFVILRIYGPLKSWFDQTWRPSEIVKVS
ncbi:MAG: DUF1254 domain-containing protein [Anaerolineales bacterium]|nr:DUF1254 domain-containing protein [Anaerolineales bacterium]